MAQWSRELIIKHFYYLVNQKGISLNEFEESAGEKARYLACMKKVMQRFQLNSSLRPAMSSM